MPSTPTRQRPRPTTEQASILPTLEALPDPVPSLSPCEEISTTQDLNQWYTIDQAAAVTGLSRKTLERRIAAGNISAAKRPQPGRRPAIVLAPETVEALTTAPPAVTLPPLVAPHPPPPNAPPLIITTAPPPPPHIPHWLTLDQAAYLSGITPATLRNFCKCGILRHIRDGRSLKISTADLEAFSRDLSRPVSRADGAC